MSDPALGNVMGGALKLKGGIKKKKKKGKKGKKEKKEKKEKEKGEKETKAAAAEFIAEEEAADVQSYEEIRSTMTESERRYHEKKLARDVERAKESAHKSHRERVNEFNTMLSTISEHHDIPRVGPG